MLPEIASSTDDRPRLRSSARVPQTNGIHADLRETVGSVLAIETESSQGDSRSVREILPLVGGSNYVATFTGRLMIESEAAYSQLETALQPVKYMPVFREEGGKHIVHIFVGREKPADRPWWPNAILLIITILSVLIVGTEMAISEIAGTGASDVEIEALIMNFFGEMWRGLPYAISIMLILGAHELGHYFAGRRHKLAVTLPYFIPAPNSFGTFGAFIQLREPMRNRKVLLDVGAAGPLLGLIFAIPILYIGLRTSTVDVIRIGMLEGNSFLYALMKTVAFGRFLPDGIYDVFVNQLAWAGWTGLLVTGLNLIPMGQLDGGHILYSLIGERARQLYMPFMIAIVALVLLTISTSPVWVLWAVLLLFFGRTYAVPLDNITPLDPRRRVIAILGLIVFVVTFVPIPLQAITEAPRIAPIPDGAVSIGLPIVVGLVTLLTRRRR